MDIKNNLFWFYWVIISEIKKGKFKSVLRYLYDSQYRKDINKLRHHLFKGKMESKFMNLRLSWIHFSHDINYPEWVTQLLYDLISGKRFKPIKVIHDGEKFLVIDGNHRLMALKRYYVFNDPLIQVRYLYRPEEEAS